MVELLLEQNRSFLGNTFTDQQYEQQRQYYIERVISAWNNGNIDELFTWIDNHAMMTFVVDNRNGLRKRGMFGEALCHAYTMNKNIYADKHILNHLFSLSDKEKLKAVGDPMPTRD